MNSSLRRIGQIGRLAVAFAALALPSAAIAAQAAPKPDLTATARLARHFEHEDALYGLKYTSAETRPAAEAMALHFKHEDALYQAHGSASGQVRAALPPEATASAGFDWNVVLVGVGSAVALMLLSVAAIVGVRRGRSRLVQS